MKFCRGHELIDASKREQDRLGNVTSLIDQSIHTLTLPDLQHHLFLLTLSGNLYNAPIQVGCTTSLTLEPGLAFGLSTLASSPSISSHTSGHLTEISATEFSAANVIGMDLSPIQPEL